MRRHARRAAAYATTAWARDARSYANLEALLGDEFDAARHHQGVDMAFALEPREPERSLSTQLDAWLDAGDEVAGINVSGLIASDPVRPSSATAFARTTLRCCAGW